MVWCLHCGDVSACDDFVTSIDRGVFDAVLGHRVETCNDRAVDALELRYLIVRAAELGP